MHFDSEHAVGLADGYWDLGGLYIEMSGVPHGMMAALLVKDGRVDHLEIAVYGEARWDGVEREWSIA